MPIYEHVCESCNNEWEESYSIKADPPKVCPACGKETVKRVISLGGKGVVELYGRDLKDKVMADTKALKKELHSNEYAYANAIGESRYQDLQTKMDRRGK